MNQEKYLFLFGTRPEAIKLAPLIIEGKRRQLDLRVCFTGQHEELARPLLKFFEIEPEIDLKLMKPNQGLNDISIGVLSGLKQNLHSWKPTTVFVQGDTTSAAIGALFAFYEKIKVIHIEAGLRTYDMTSPWPEEFNRRLISLAAGIHFVPTASAKNNLLQEGVDDGKIFEVGNTGIDALRIACEKVQPCFSESKTFKILVTLHRRESFGSELKSVMMALKNILKNHSEVQMLWPLHENPQVKMQFAEIFPEIPTSLKLSKALDYPDFVKAMLETDLIITDSGGIQEEAPFLGKPTLVCRQKTERPEAVKSGNSILCGTDREKIEQIVKSMIPKKEAYQKMANKNNLYGDGFSSAKIWQTLQNLL